MPVPHPGTLGSGRSRAPLRPPLPAPARAPVPPGRRPSMRVLPGVLAPPGRQASAPVLVAPPMLRGRGPCGRGVGGGTRAAKAGSML